jgi:hypothetical protein
MRVKHRDLARAAARVEEPLGWANASVTWIKVNATYIAHRANSDLDDGVRGISYEPSPRGSDISDPTGRKATSPPDPVARLVVGLADAIRSAERHARAAMRDARRAEDIAKALMSIDPDIASQLAGADQVHEDQAKAYICANRNCQRTVANTPTDRLRGGRCDPCRKYLSRTGEERPAHLCAISSDSMDAVVSADGLGLDADRLITSP